MKIDKDKSEFLSEVIEQWQSDNLIDDVTANRLKQSYETKTFDWYRLAQYSFWVAMACGFISLGAFLIDDSVLNYLKKIYDTPDILISVLSAGLAVWLYFLGFRRKRKQKHLRFSNEAILFSAILLTANAIAYFGKTLDNGSGHFSILILISAIVYALIGYCYESKLTWVFALISLGTWFGTETGYLSRKDFYFLGMNYPLRFVAFGLVLTLASLVLCRFKKLSQFYEVTFISGMIYLFTSLWLLSVFGNYGTLEAWYGVKQISLFYFAIISSVCCVISIWIGLKYRNDIAREFGIVFLFLNLYTRYFEYFWDSWHKALFFLVLAASFWLIGRKAEKIWNLEFLK